MTEKTTLNDLGVSLQILCTENDLFVDISAAPTQEIILKKPDGTEVAKSAAFLTDGTDGIVAYSTLAGDIDQIGIWNYRAKITFNATQVYYSEWAEFTVTA